MSTAEVNATIVLTDLVAYTTPILFAASGEYAAERSGTLNISIEGMMLAGCYASVVGAHISGSSGVGFLCGMAAGLLIALVHGNLSHRLAANTFVVGLTLNVLVLGITSYFYQQYPNANTGPKLPYYAVPGLSKIPVVGPSVFDQQWPVYVLFALVPAVWWLVQRTKWGLEVRASGENPESADATGIRVNVRRRQSLYLCGALSGAGGAYLAIGITGGFTPDMTVGIGYLAISAVIFGGWTMTGTVLGCIVIGGIYSLGLSLPSIGARINGELQLALPYLAALGAMVFFAKSQRAPRALARPFTRGVA